MIVSSIAQAASLISPASCGTSFANDRSGIAHIVPMTWQKAKARTINRMFAWTVIMIWANRAPLNIRSSLCSFQQVHQVRCCLQK